MRLFHVFPQPTTIRLGAGLSCSPLRLRHLAQIESWLASQKANPVDELLDYVHDSQGRERQIRAAEAIWRRRTGLLNWEVPRRKPCCLPHRGCNLSLGSCLTSAIILSPATTNASSAKLYRRRLQAAYPAGI